VVRFFVRVNAGFMCVGFSSSWLEGKAKTPAESEVLHRNHLRCRKRFSPCILFVRL